MAIALFLHDHGYLDECTELIGLGTDKIDDLLEPIQENLLDILHYTSSYGISNLFYSRADSRLAQTDGNIHGSHGSNAEGEQKSDPILLRRSMVSSFYAFPLMLLYAISVFSLFAMFFVASQRFKSSKSVKRIDENIRKLTEDITELEAAKNYRLMGDFEKNTVDKDLADKVGTRAQQRDERNFIDQNEQTLRVTAGRPIYYSLAILFLWLGLRYPTELYKAQLFGNVFPMPIVTILVVLLIALVAARYISVKDEDHNVVATLGFVFITAAGLIGLLFSEKILLLFFNIQFYVAVVAIAIIFAGIMFMLAGKNGDDDIF